MTELTAEQKFQEKIIERLRENIGDLMPDDVLRGIIDRAMHKIFFDERIERNQYGHETRHEPWLNKIVKECVEEQVKVMLVDWMAANADKTEAMIKDLIAEGMGSMALRAINQIFADQMGNLERQVIERMRNPQ